MSEAKPTPGEWLFEPGTDGSWWVVVLSELDMGVHKTIASRGQWLHNQAESLANGALLHDAGNTYNTTGLTPSQLVERVKEMEEALTSAQQAINSMKVEAETAAQGDEQMMLDACETISNEGLQADMEIRAALSKARPNTAEGEAAQQAPAAERENLELRRMLCIAHAGAAAYMDDGEAQDNRELPLIDFLHDTPAEIQDKLQRRALKKLAMTTEATTARWPSYEVAVSDPVFQVARSIMGTENMGQDRQLVAAINHVLAAAPTPAAAKEPSP